MSYRGWVTRLTVPESDPERFSAMELTLSREKVQMNAVRAGRLPPPARTERVSAGMTAGRWPRKILSSSGSA